MAGDDDLDWLYRRDRRRPGQRPQPPRPDQGGTRVFSPEEVARLQQSAGTQPPTEPGERRARSRTDVRPAPAPPPQSPPPPGRPRKRRRPGRKIAAVLAIVVVLFVAYLVVVPLLAWNGTAQVDDQPPGDRPAAQPGRTYLLVGSDSREGLSEEEQKELGTGDVAGQRTDTMMILAVPPEGRPALISIPRDSYVAIPGHGQNKINAAFAFGGPELLTQTIEQATGLRIDHYVEIGFGGFVQIIDALGGIEMCIPEDITDANAHLDVKKGCQTLDGVTALAYVRMRYQDPRGDLGRVERQRDMVSAVASKAARAETVINPMRYWQLNHAIAGALRLGETTGMLDMPPVALAMRDLGEPGALTLTVPIAGNITTPAGASLAWDEEAAAELFSTIASGSTEGLEKFVED